MKSFLCPNSKHAIAENNNLLNDPLQNLGLNRNGMTIGHLNTQGLTSKFDELRVLMSSNKIDIFGLTLSLPYPRTKGHRQTAWIQMRRRVTRRLIRIQAV